MAQKMEKQLSELLKKLISSTSSMLSADGDTSQHLLKCLTSVLSDRRLKVLSSVRNNAERTVLHMAASCSDLNITYNICTSLPKKHWFELLNIVDCEGKTAVHVAAAEGYTEAIKLMLVPLPASEQLKLLDNFDKHYNTPKLYAQLNNQEETYTFLDECYKSAYSMLGMYLLLLNDFGLEIGE